MFYLHILSGSATDKPPVLVTAGVHAREWAPPDAVLSFVEKLLAANLGGTPISYPAFVDTTSAPPITYPAFSIPIAEVRRIVTRLNLFVVPLMNPDGREFTQAATANINWRKNRRPHASGGDCIGVDLNRNFNIAWDFNAYYSAAAAPSVSSSTNPCDFEVYVGPAVASEPETQNALSLITGQRVTFLLDVHSQGRHILYPWGLEDNQSSDPTMNFLNTSWDRAGVHAGRDGQGGVYGEFIPNSAPVRLLDSHVLLGNRMAAAILATAGADATARARSTYLVQQSMSGLYPTSGAIDDFTFSNQLRGTPSPPIFAFTLECGHITEGGFWPDYVTQYPKVEREVHAVLRAFLTYPATWTPPTASSSSSRCFVATAAFGSSYYPQVEFLRDLRDRVFPATPFGVRFMRVIDRFYYSFSPALARHLNQHEVARRLTRALLSPFVAWLRIAERSARRIKKPEKQVAILAGVVMMTVLAAAAVAGGLLTFLFWLLANR